MATDSTVDNRGVIRGGNGGNGGDGSPGGPLGYTGIGGSGASAGHGVVAGNGTLINSGTITGGDGGLGGMGLVDGGTAVGRSNLGFGGVGVLGSNLTIINSGTISGGFIGGFSGSEAARVPAILFVGTNNRLELQAGSVINGIVDATLATGNTLALGGSANSSFDVSSIGPAAQYRGFGAYEKTGGSTWTLTGTTTQVTPWTLREGSLSIASDGSLGDVSGTLTLAGGTLLTTAPITTARAVAMAGGTIQSDADLTLTGTISGTGGVTKTGAGTLTATGTGGYSGTTQIAAGTMAVANGGSLATGDVGVGGVSGSNATLRVDGQNSTWQASSILVGRAGTGAMNVTTGGRVVITGGGLNIADNPGQDGTVTVSGAGATVTTTDVLTLGGVGSATVSNGGRIVSSGTAAAGNNPGGQGTFVVTGAGSV
ncbi:autotransporter domain-containing protein, partial [Reyranella sp. CPCC 100927]